MYSINKDNIDDFDNMLNNQNKSFVSVAICGGIGNQLFQIASVLDYSSRANKIPVFLNVLDLPNAHNYERKTQWNTLFSNKLNVIDRERFSKIVFRRYHEKREVTYNTIPLMYGNIYLTGYYQAYQYISDNTKEIMKSLIYSNDSYMKIAHDMYDKIKHHFNDMSDDNFVSIHVRRGDYLKVSEFHTVLNESYYKNAYDKVCENGKKHIVVFSDEIDWCKNNFKITDNIYYVDINDCCIELILMSLFKHNIIANSTFSWWATFISDYQNKIVVAPKNWFGPSGYQEHDDLYLPNWHIM